MTGDETSRLRADLMSADPSVQILAARRCARAKPTELVHELIALGSSSNAEVRAAAYWALDQMRVGAAIPQLVAGLDDADFVARSNAGWALVHLGSEVLPFVEATAAHSANADTREMAGLVLAHVARDGATAVASPALASTARVRLGDLLGGAANAINNDLSVVASIALDLGESLPPDAAPGVHEDIDAMRGFGARLYASAAGFNKAFCALVRAEHVDHAARIEVVSWARTLGNQLTAIDGYATQLLEGSEVLTVEIRADLALIRRCVRGAFDVLRPVCAHLLNATS